MPFFILFKVKFPGKLKPHYKLKTSTIGENTYFCHFIGKNFNLNEYLRNCI